MKGLSKEAVERMEGLISIKEWCSFKESVYELVNDLLEEGFEEGDITLFLTGHITRLVKFCGKEL